MPVILIVQTLDEFNFKLLTQILRIQDIELCKINIYIDNDKIMRIYIRLESSNIKAYNVFRDLLPH